MVSEVHIVHPSVIHPSFIIHQISNSYIQAKDQASAKASSSSGGGKQKKKKWSKGKTKEKSNNAVFFDKPTFEKLFKEVPTYKLITLSVLVDRLKISGSLARKALRELEAKGHIKKVSGHAALSIYTRATAAVEEEASKKDAKATKA